MTARWLARLLPYAWSGEGRTPSRWSRSRMRRVVVVGYADTPFNVGYSVHLSWLLANLGTHSAPARNSYQSAHSLPRRLSACPCTLPTPSLLLYSTAILELFICHDYLVNTSSQTLLLFFFTNADWFKRISINKQLGSTFYFLVGQKSRRRSSRYLVKK